MYSEIFTGLLGVLVGVFIGHRLSLGRDIRREHNEIVQPVRLSILKAIGDMEEGYAWKNFTDSDLDSIRNIYNDKQRLLLDSVVSKYWDAYKQAHEPDGAGGQIIIKDNIGSVISAAKDIREFIKPK